MSDRVITDTAQIDTDWLDEVLVRGGALHAAGVLDFSVEALAGDNSRINRIQIRYRPGAVGRGPASVLLKMCESGNEFVGQSEVDYYRRDYVALEGAPVPACYDAQYSVETNAYHVLMEDLSASHRNNWGVRPTRRYGRAVAEALSTLHAHYWVREELRTDELALPDRAAIERYFAHIRPGLSPLLEATRTEIDDASRRALSDIFEHHPAKMLERTNMDAGFTLVHGDVNPGNILSPLDGRGKTYLIDRQPFDWSLTVWLGASDLAYLMVHWWDTDLRRAFELPTLRAYHDHLSSRGVKGYEWEQLVRDYRLSAVQSVYVAIQWCALEADRERMRWVWLPQLQKSLRAFFDLRCADLWRA